MNVQMRVQILRTLIHYSSTLSHTSEEENRTRNRSENCQCILAFKKFIKYQYAITPTLLLNNVYSHSSLTYIVSSLFNFWNFFLDVLYVYFYKKCYYNYMHETYTLL
jgi:hypothetical protein